MAPWGLFVNPLGSDPDHLTKPAPWGHTVRPMDGAANTPLEQAIVTILYRNELEGDGPSSIRALAKEMVRLTEGEEAAADHNKVESRRRNLRRYLTGESGYLETTRTLIATAARARPGEIPPSVPRTGLRQRVEELERENQELRSRLDRLLENP